MSRLFKAPIDERSPGSSLFCLLGPSFIILEPLGSALWSPCFLLDLKFCAMASFCEYCRRLFVGDPLFWGIDVLGLFCGEFLNANSTSPVASSVVFGLWEYRGSDGAPTALLTLLSATKSGVSLLGDLSSGVIESPLCILMLLFASFLKFYLVAISLSVSSSEIV